MRRAPLVWLLAGVAASVWLVSGAALLGPDAWLALSAGRFILDHGLPGGTEPWLVAADASWVDQQWLGQMVWYVTEYLTGLGGVIVLAVACAVGALVLAAYAAQRRGGQAAWVLIVGVVSLVALSPFVQARPQLLMLPAWVLLILVVEGERRRWWWLLPILIVWANVHGSVLLAAAAAALGLLLACPWRTLDARSRAGYGLLLGVILLTPLASPYAGQLPDYYARMLDPGGVAALSAEWGRLNVVSMPTLAIMVLLALGVAVYGRTTPFLRLVLTLLALATVFSARYGIWLIPLLLMTLPAWGTQIHVFRLNPRSRGAVGVAALTLVLALALTVLTLVRPPRTILGVAPEGSALAAVDAQRQCRVLTDVRLANWLLWRDPTLAGRLGVDARMELLTPERHARYQRMLAGADPVQGFEVLVLARPVARPGGQWVARQPGLAVWRADNAPCAQIARTPGGAE